MPKKHKNKRLWQKKGHGKQQAKRSARQVQQKRAPASSHRYLRTKYQAYLNSSEWKEKAEAAKKRAGYRCQLCNRPRGVVKLEAHHRTYERVGRELDEDITVLCGECHALFEMNSNNRPRDAFNDRARARCDGCGGKYEKWRMVQYGKELRCQKCL